MLRNNIKLLLLSGTAVVACTGTAHAQSTGTAAGTTISNTASVSYTVNGVVQSTNSTTASFVVDRKVNFSVAVDQASTTKVNMGQTGAVLRFKVTNTTNGTQDFLLNAWQTGIIGGLLTGTDDFDMTNVKIYVDSNGNGTYDPGIDTLSYIDELAPDASVEVFIVADTPASGSINQAVFALQVRAAAGGQAGTQGAVLLPTDLNLANADNTVDIVFADDDDDGLGVDIARNGQGWAYNSYVIGARNVALTVTKSALVLSDGVNLLNPKSLPGAVVQYCLLANNATLGTAASNVTLSDVIPANTKYVPGSVQSGTPGGTCVLVGTPIADTTAFNAATNTVSVNLGTLNGGASQAVSFKVTIN
jgi:uncharacterized repeat protein (TIGR01451 family)